MIKRNVDIFIFRFIIFDNITNYGVIEIVRLKELFKKRSNLRTSEAGWISDQGSFKVLTISVVTTDSDFIIPKITSVEFLMWGLEIDGETNLKNLDKSLSITFD